LLKLGKTRLAHTLKRELTLFACPQLKPGLPLLHVFEAGELQALKAGERVDAPANQVVL
jgi:hypothetical protein